MLAQMFIIVAFSCLKESILHKSPWYESNVRPTASKAAALNPLSYKGMIRCLQRFGSAVCNRVILASVVPV